MCDKLLSKRISVGKDIMRWAIESVWPRWYNIGKDDGVNHVTSKKEVRRMAILAKPINRIAVIKEQESKAFVHEFNKNKVTDKFLDSCKKAGKLFGKRK